MIITNSLYDIPVGNLITSDPLYIFSYTSFYIPGTAYYLNDSLSFRELPTLNYGSFISVHLLLCFMKCIPVVQELGLGVWVSPLALQPSLSLL